VIRQPKLSLPRNPPPLGGGCLTVVPEHYKFHPREEDVFSFYGFNDNIIGIHTNSILKYYRKAISGEIFYL
jgi:hypothetical protein